MAMESAMSDAITRLRADCARRTNAMPGTHDDDVREVLAALDAAEAECERLRGLYDRQCDETRRCSDEAFDATQALVLARQDAAWDIAALRKVIDGSPVPPTDAEIAAHAAVGGKWRVRAQWSRSGDRPTVDTVNSWAPQIAALLREQSDTHWWAVDANDVLCARPTVTP